MVSFPASRFARREVGPSLAELTLLAASNSWLELPVYADPTAWVITESRIAQNGLAAKASLRPDFRLRSETTCSEVGRERHQRPAASALVAQPFEGCWDREGLPVVDSLRQDVRRSS